MLISLHADSTVIIWNIINIKARHIFLLLQHAKERDGFDLVYSFYDLVYEKQTFLGQQLVGFYILFNKPWLTLDPNKNIFICCIFNWEQ